MEVKPILSIVVPIFNAKLYLPKCIGSVLTQSFDDFELILVDDGSTDGSGALCDEIALSDKRVRSFHKKNGGAASARKYGVEQSAGEWIMFVDGDDTIPKDALAKLFETPDICEYDIVAGTCNIYDQHIYKNNINKCILDKYEYIKALLLDNVQIGPYAKLYKRELFNDIDWDVSKEIFQNEDLLMLITLTLNANKIYVNQDAVCYNYIFHRNGMSQLNMPYEAWLMLFDQIEKRILQLPNYEYVKKSFFIYRIRRLYFNNILKGNIFRTRDPYIQSLINESKDYCLFQKEQKIVKLLEHSCLRREKYLSYKITPIIKTFIKQIFRIKK